jgi:hypothetical protein
MGEEENPDLKVSATFVAGDRVPGAAEQENADLKVGTTECHAVKEERPCLKP